MKNQGVRQFENKRKNLKKKKNNEIQLKNKIQWMI